MKNQFELEDSYAYLIYRTVRALRRQFIRLAAEQGYDLYPEQWFVLVRLFNNPGCSQVELAKDFEDRPSMTRALRAMKEKGWLSIAEDPEDKRKNKIHLTKVGLQLFDTIAKEVSKERNRMFNAFDEKDYKHFRKIMDTIFTKAME